MRRWFFLLVPLLLGAAIGEPAPADFRGDNGPVVVSSDARYIFGREILFSSTVQSEESIRQASLVLQPAGAQPVYYPAQISSGENTLLEAQRDLATEPLFPFSMADYWWEWETEHGEKNVSERRSLEYSDDRFDWQRLEVGWMTVEWTEGSSDQAEDAAELLGIALGGESADLETPIPGKIRLYIYPRLADLQSGLGELAHGWEGAFSDPASGIILVAAAPDAEGRRTLAILLPHEVTHILLFTKWREAYYRLPAWLVEGLAAGYEMEPRPELDRILTDANRIGGLFPLSTLCQSFPVDENSAMIAYAESRSFVVYLKETYGLPDIRRAIETFASGASCTGPFGSTGKPLEELEAAWRGRMTGNRDGSPDAVPLIIMGALGVLGTVLGVGWIIRRKRKAPTVEGKMK